MRTGLIKGFGLEFEFGGKWAYAAVPFIGELCVEFGSSARGRWWADCLTEGSKDLSLYLGSTHIVLSAYRSAATERGTWERIHRCVDALNVAQQPHAA